MQPADFMTPPFSLAKSVQYKIHQGHSKCNISLWTKILIPLSKLQHCSIYTLLKGELWPKYGKLVIKCWTVTARYENRLVYNELVQTQYAQTWIRLEFLAVSRLQEYLWQCKQKQTHPQSTYKLVNSDLLIIVFWLITCC